MASLAKIATKIKDLAAAKAPVKTGNLKRKIADFNRPSGMVKETKTKSGRSFEFSLDVSPPGAEYGKYWNDPTVSETVEKGKTKNVPKAINFAQKAYDDPSVQKMIDDYIKTIQNEISDEIGKSLDDLDR
jgi:hypothetical protein